MAETVGFEPTEGFNTLTVLAGPRTRPYYATSPCTPRGTGIENTCTLPLEPTTASADAFDPHPNTSPVKYSRDMEQRGTNVELSEAEEAFAREIARLALYIPRVFEADIGREIGMTTSEFFTLAHLADSALDSERMSDLAAATALSLSATTKVVGRLSKLGLITKTRSATDARSFDVALTNLGRERLRDMRPQHVAGVRSRLLEPVRGHDLPALTAAIASIINSEHAAPLAAASSPHKEVIAS